MADKINRRPPGGNGTPLPTPDGIRANGEAMAAQIERFAEESRAKGEELYTRSIEIARLVRDAAENSANEFEDHFVRCREAMEIVELHLQALTPALPQPRRIEDNRQDQANPIPGFLAQGPRDD